MGLKKMVKTAMLVVSVPVAILSAMTAYQLHRLKQHEINLVTRQVDLVTEQTKLAVVQAAAAAAQRDRELARANEREAELIGVRQLVLAEQPLVQRTELPAPRAPLRVETLRASSFEVDRPMVDSATLSARVAAVRRRMLAQARVDPAGARRTPDFFALARQALAADDLASDDCRWLQATGNEIFRTLGADIPGGTFRLEDRDEQLCGELRAMECAP